MADIGEKLRSAREAKGLSIEDIEKATKIQGRYLTAIEQDEFEKLPGDFYVRAFIRQYAQIVGLDGKELLSEYHQDIPQAEPEEYVEDSIDNKSEEVRKATSNKKKLWQDYLPRILIGLGIIAVLLICYVVYAHFSANNNQDNNSANDVSVSSDSPKKRKKKKIKRNSVKIKELAANQYQITGLKNNRNLVVRAGDQDTTVTIAINGVRQNAQTLTAGQKHTMLIPSATHSMVITFSNATGTSITIGGKKVPYDAQTAYLSLTFFIGKQRVNQQDQSNNNSGTTSNSNHNSSTGHVNNNQGQGQHQSNNNGNTNNGTQQNNSNNQSGQNNNQGGHENNQSNSNDNNSQTNHSEGSSNSNGDGKD